MIQNLKQYQGPDSPLSDWPLFHVPASLRLHINSLLLYYGGKMTGTVLPHIIKGKKGVFPSGLQRKEKKLLLPQRQPMAHCLTRSVCITCPSTDWPLWTQKWVAVTGLRQPKRTSRGEGQSKTIHTIWLRMSGLAKPEC